MAPVSSPDRAVIEIDPHRNLLEWFSIDKSDTDISAANIEWTGILKEVRQQPGCTVAAHAFTSETPIQEWVIIEWKNLKSRAQFLSSDRSSRLHNAMEHMRKVLMQPLNLRGGLGHVIRANPIDAPALYEVWIAFFPSDLSVATAKGIERIEGPVHLGRNPSGQEDPQAWVFDGFLSRHCGWADGEVSYEGQPARRMVYLFHWMNNEIQQRYKQEVRWATRDGRLIGHDAMEVFIYDLEEQGMLGYESHNSRFLEVTPF